MDNKIDNVPEDTGKKVKKSKSYRQARWLTAKVVLFSLVTVILLAVFFWYQIERYEQGIINVYASQQDAYVQLVLDQINLKENRDDEEIITEILASLDASSNRYWTFSKAQSMLFVKDVLETNKYKEITADSFFSTGESKNFLDSLTLNRVTHKEIFLQDKNYVASGVLFEYSGSEYRLCLMTNKDILLDNNYYLGSKVLLWTAIGVVLICMFLFTSLSAKLHQADLLKYEDSKEEISLLQKSVAELNEELRNKRTRDTKSRLWSELMFADFINRIRERNILPVSAVYVQCRDDDVKKEVLADASISLDESVLRFEEGEHDLLFLGVGLNKNDLYTSISPVLTYGCLHVDAVEINTLEELETETIRKKIKEKMVTWQS